MAGHTLIPASPPPALTVSLLSTLAKRVDAGIEISQYTATWPGGMPASRLHYRNARQPPCRYDMVLSPWSASGSTLALEICTWIRFRPRTVKADPTTTH